MIRKNQKKRHVLLSEKDFHLLNENAKKNLHKK